MGVVSAPVVVIKVPSIPYGAVPAPPIIPHLSNASNLDTFSAAYKNIAEEKTIDKTKHAMRETWSGVSIGAPDMKMLEAKDKPADNKEIKQILGARPEKLQIEHKKGKRGGKNGARRLQRSVQHNRL
jgi:hypothetical protein